MNTPLEQSEPALITPSPTMFYWRAWLAVGIGLMAVGMLGISWTARNVDARCAANPWAECLVVSGDAPIWGSMIPGWLLDVPLDNYPPNAVLDALRAAPDGQDAIKQLHLDTQEKVVWLPTLPGMTDAMLADGRMPEPGQPEVLAGALCRMDSFKISDTAYRVVGHIKPEVGSFAYSFVGLFPPDGGASPAALPGAKQIWFDPDGAPGEGDERLQDAPRNVARLAGVTPIPGLWSAASLGGLILFAAGGACVWWVVFMTLAERLPGFAGGLFRAMRTHSRLMWGITIAAYAIMFLPMIIVLLNPWIGLRAIMIIQGILSSGPMRNVGEAYLSGNITAATFHTWLWNYGMGTVLTTLAPSLIIPFAGAFKTSLSFIFLGLGLAPAFGESTSILVRHCGTFVLELHAYIVAVFATTLYPLKAFQAIREKKWLPYFDGLRVMTGAAFWVAVMLAIAALYEAVSLTPLTGR